MTVYGWKDGDDIDKDTRKNCVFSMQNDIMFWFILSSIKCFWVVSSLCFVFFFRQVFFQVESLDSAIFFGDDTSTSTLSPSLFFKCLYLS